MCERGLVGSCALVPCKQLRRWTSFLRCFRRHERHETARTRRFGLVVMMEDGRDRDCQYTLHVLVSIAILPPGGVGAGKGRHRAQGRGVASVSRSYEPSSAPRNEVCIYTSTLYQLCININPSASSVCVPYLPSIHCAISPVSHRVSATSRLSTPHYPRPLRTP